MKHSTLAVAATTTATWLLVAGCTGTGGGETSTSEGGGDDGPLRYLVEQPEDPALLKDLEDHLGDFEESSGIDVELEALPLENMRTVLQTQLRSGQGPDVFNWGSGPGYAGALAEAGLLQDLTAAYEENDWPIYDFARERVTFDGQTVGIPGEMETIGLYYNKTLFEELGIEEPQSLADVQAAAQTLSDEGIVPLAVSDQEGWQGGHLLSMSLSSELGSEGMDKLLTGETAWDSPEVVSALEVWADLQEQGHLPETPTSLSYDGGNALFFSGDAGMLPTGSWLITELQDSVDFEVGYIPWPAADGPGIFTGGLGSGPFVSARTSRPEDALELIDFLASPEHAQWTVETLGTIPPQPVETADLDVSPLFGQVLQDTTAFSDGSGDLGYNIDVLTTDVFNQAMWNGVQALLSGQRSAEQVAQDLEAASQK